MTSKQALKEYYNLKNIDSNKTYHLVISPRNTGRKKGVFSA